jgi:diaminohydroxyphosphoribosylaminopyrimidine deaminase/5-amino-6-(5-phosphoribosylamino)uracil reductase
MVSDEKWMRRALLLAERGRGYVHPNPMVGAILVKNGRVVSEGFHRVFGQAHAEVEAIRRAGTRAKGGTLYVNLEPCSHWGKTPPCVDLILSSGIKRVVAAIADPNPLVSGKGFSGLKKGHVAITKGVLEKEARTLNRAFITWITKKRPFVTMKVAASLDGKTSTMTGESKWISGEPARRAGHALRAEADAIAVGAGTVLEDNPSLTAHGLGRNPVRIIFAGRRALPRKAKIFNSAAPTWVLKESRGRINLHKALADLAGRGIAHLLVEGGGTLQQSFLEAGVVDEVVWFIAPMIIGKARHLKDAKKLEHAQITTLGPDLCVNACLQESFRRSAK